MAAQQQNLTLPQALSKLNWANRRCKFAWAQYYRAENTAHNQDHAHYRIIVNQVAADNVIPTHIKDCLTEMAKQLKKKWECPICLDFIPDGTLEITNCGHFYCKGCLTQLKNKAQQDRKDKWQCSVCRKSHTFSD